MSPYLITTLALLPMMILMMVAGQRVQSTFNKFSQVATKKNVNAKDAAEHILKKNGINGVQIKPCKGKLTDHYDPRDNTVYLSEDVYNSSSVAALGVAAHEVGHAIQYNDNYIPVKIRTAIVPAVNFCNKLAMPLLLVGFLIEIMMVASAFSNIVITLGIVFYSATALFTLITLPVEFNASKRALVQLEECNIICPDEVKQANSVLRAAASTYVISFAFSILQLIRIIAIFGRNRN